MNAERLTSALDARLRERRLLDHPFYRRWTAGEVSVEELRDYAAQYRHFESMLPAHLACVAATAEHPALAEQARRNLADEAGAEPTHLQLFDAFAGALGADTRVAPSPAMQAMLDVYAGAAARGADRGFAALLAYEVQAAGVAASKAAGLRQHGVLEGDALAFWDLHATLDADHAQWAIDALVRSGADADAVVGSAGAAADAWWAFLDEREALRA